MSDQNETPSVTHKWRGSSNNKLRKVHVTFDNFAYLRDDTVSWMEPDELAALPVLLADELWENYHRARIAHQAAVDAILHALKYPDGSADSEVCRQQEVFDELYGLYCDWTNKGMDGLGEGMSNEEYSKQALESMFKLLQVEKAKGGL